MALHFDRAGAARRSRLALLGAALLALACGDGRPPDVQLLVVDTLRADHLGAYGYERPTSPAFDAFATESTVFEDVLASSSWTLPSVASFLTGTHPRMHGMRMRVGAGARRGDGNGLRPGLATLPEVFAEAGYRTVAVVSNPWVANTGFGLGRGFEQFEAMTWADAGAVNERARALLASDDPRPVFLYLHYMDVHGPYRRPEADPGLDLGPVPARYRDERFYRLMGGVPKYLRIEGFGHLSDYVDAYDRGIRAWDRHFGAWLAWLAEDARLDRTILSVISDHGEEFLEHGGWNHGETLFQEQLAVPWLLRVPGRAGRRVREPASGIDVSPTLLGAAGLAVPPTMQGRDLWRSPGEAERSLYAETEVQIGGKRARRGDAKLALRRGDAKWIRTGEGWHCLDLARDPDERAPLVADCGPALAAELARWEAQMDERAAAAREGATVRLDPAQREELRALGYLE